MRKFLLGFIFIGIIESASAQKFAAVELLDIQNLPQKKRDNLLQRKNFVRFGGLYESAGVDYHFNSPRSKDGSLEDSVRRGLINCVFSAEGRVTYITSSEKEFNGLKAELAKGGFLPGYSADLGDFYQRLNQIVRVETQLVDSVPEYQFTVLNHPIPDPMKCTYADDLLAFQSHQMLLAAFGEKNVRKDNYYFSTSQLQKCTVLFPNTPRQAIFIWEDEANNRMISHILIGGTLRAESSLSFNQTIAQNAWELRNGLRTGLELDELIELNQHDFSFFGYGSDFPGIVVPDKNGELDFKKTGVMLSCLNCYDASSLMQQERVDAKAALESSKRLFVKAIIVMPDPNN